MRCNQYRYKKKKIGTILELLIKVTLNLEITYVWLLNEIEQWRECFGAAPAKVLVCDLKAT